MIKNSELEQVAQRIHAEGQSLGIIPLGMVTELTLGNKTCGITYKLTARGSCPGGRGDYMRHPCYAGCSFGYLGKTKPEAMRSLEAILDTLRSVTDHARKMQRKEKVA